MNKIDFQNLPSTETPINAENLNQMQTNIEEAVNESSKEKYSTDEQVIGTWINGKPLYRKVIETTTPTVATDGTSAWRQVIIPNVAYGRVVSSDSILGANTRRSIILFHGKDNSALYVRSHFLINTSNNNGVLEIECNNTAYNDKPVIAIVEYTKTTD